MVHPATICALCVVRYTLIKTIAFATPQVFIMCTIESWLVYNCTQWAVAMHTYPS
jgi:hypothetical protein